MVNWNSTALESKPNECKMHLIKQMESNIDTTLSAPTNNIFVSKLSKMTNINCQSQQYYMYVWQNKIEYTD